MCLCRSDPTQSRGCNLHSADYLSKMFEKDVDPKIPHGGCLVCLHVWIICVKVCSLTNICLPTNSPVEVFWLKHFWIIGRFSDMTPWLQGASKEHVVSVSVSRSVMTPNSTDVIEAPQAASCATAAIKQSADCRSICLPLIGSPIHFNCCDAKGKTMLRVGGKQGAN